MAVYSITYDLNSSDKDYKDLYNEIQSLGSWAHYLESTWLVDTSLSSNDISKRLKKVIDSNDSLFIAQITTNYAGWMHKDFWDWLKKHLG